MESGALIAAILAEPEAVAPFLEYADWLIDQGDPRGELIQLQLIAESGGSTDAHRIWIKTILADEERLLSPRLADVAHYWSFRFRRGFIRSAALCGGADDPPAIDAVEALVADPHMGLLAWIALTHPASETVTFWRPLLESPRPHLRELVVSNLGAGAALLHNLPSLQMLDITGPSAVEHLAHERLRRLRCRPLQSMLSPSDIAAIERGAISTFPGAVTGGFELPALEELQWMIGDHDEILTNPRSMFHRPPPKLQRLHLTHRVSVLPELVRCAVTKQLRMLCAPGDLKELVEVAPQLRHLEELELEPRAAAKVERDEMLELRGTIERALPNTKLDIKWDLFVRGVPTPREPLDHESRDDGHVDAIGAWIHGRTT